MNRELKIFSGNANLSLAQEIAVYLGQRLGEATVSSFSDGEIRVKIDE
ncbi:MAG: ribose-phosphate pyrophosphokinase-like domain-containing protein, partial [Nitrospirota bacterium]